MGNLVCSDVILCVLNLVLDLFTCGWFVFVFVDVFLWVYVFVVFVAGCWVLVLCFWFVLFVLLLALPVWVYLRVVCNFVVSLVRAICFVVTDC